jgi:hypothetical protein
MPVRPILTLPLAGLLCLCLAPGAPAEQGGFDKAVAPFLKKHCVQCHGPQKKKADLVLHVYKDDKSLLKDRKVWQNVLQLVNAGEMPPSGKPRPAMAEIENFARAVHGIFEKADRAAGRDPGRVTMRRLNRAEYNNTIRDLVGVDFQPAEDFPSDDVGYGFDNIGDVLTLSPLLMERYLAAAETIVQRAIIVGDPPKAPERPTSAIFLLPRERPFSEKSRFRKLFKNEEQLQAPHTLTEDGEYTAKVRVYGQQAGKEPVKFALLVDDKVVQTFDVKEDSDKKAATYKAKVELNKGKHVVTVKLLNEFKEEAKDGKDGKQRGLFVQVVHLEGPAGMPASHRLIMEHKPGLDQAAATREIVTRFASRAFRRPATTDEVDRLLTLVDKAQKNGEKWEAGIQLALQAVLVSPKYLFRVEIDHRPTDKGTHPLDDYQLASRLSYFLWSSMPDDQLFALAAKKALHQNLETQVKRMLQDSRSQALVDNFAMQWLQLRTLRNFTPDAKLFPSFDDSLRTAMVKETELFLQAIIREDRSILDLIDGPFTYLNERLAQHYGIADTNGNSRNGKATKPRGEQIPREQFVRVALQGGERGGILGQASVLAVTSNPTRTSPVKRGRWVLEQILGTPPPPPPPDVPDLPEGEKAELKGSLRQRMEQHRSNPSCANCHARLDPLGFAFENYDAIGRFRTKDGNFPIDPSGELPGGVKFQGAGELKQILKGKKDLFSRCLTEKLLTYGLGRGLEYYDKAPVDRILQALEKKDYRFSALVIEIVKSDPFRMRRGKEEVK